MIPLALVAHGVNAGIRWWDLCCDVFEVFFRGLVLLVGVLP